MAEPPADPEATHGAAGVVMVISTASAEAVCRRGGYATSVALLRPFETLVEPNVIVQTTGKSHAAPYDSSYRL